MPPSPNFSVLAQVRDLQARGCFLSAHDVAMAALAAGAPDLALRHLAVLSLAQAGARTSALRLVDQWDLRTADDPELAGLYPRLLKDLALEERRPADAQAAAQAYQALWVNNANAWHGVNAAAMHLLAGNLEASQSIARQLAMLDDQGNYWSAATLAEAWLLLGDAAQARAWLRTADSRAGNDYSCRATTRRQLRWEAGLLGADAALLDLLRIPQTIHFCGTIPGPATAVGSDERGLHAALRSALAGVGFAFGSLAAGGDIAVTEAALSLGIAVTIVLPYAVTPFIERSVQPAGEDWVERFDRCLKQVDLRVLDETAPQDDLDFGLAARRAMGLARLHASRLESRVWQLAVWDGEGDAQAVAGTASDVATWRQAGGETRVLGPCWPRKPAPVRPAAGFIRKRGAVVFTDLLGFGGFDDRALAAFYAGPMVAMGHAVTRASPRYRNAWGDAIQLVFDAPAEAAACALALRAALAPNALRAAGVESELALRLALDFGGLHPVFDAVQGVDKFAGRTMTRAARIEPITPPGMIYATEAFACEVALLKDSYLACDYAGIVPTAKGFGILPIYAVRDVKASGNKSKRGRKLR